MKKKKSCISVSVSPSGVLLLALLTAGLGLAAAESGSSTLLPDVLSGDAEKLGACVKGTTALAPSRGRATGLGCDSVLKFAADGTRPDDTPEGAAKFAEAVDKCCGLLTDNAKSSCTCPLQDAMDKVCSNGGAAETLRQQCGGGAGNSQQDAIRRAGQLGACVDRSLYSAGGAGSPVGCGSVLRQAAGKPGALSAEFLGTCCSALTDEEDARGDCTCPLLDAMEKVCGEDDVEALRQKCAADPCERLFQRLDAEDVQACRDKIKALEDSCKGQ